jgi:hypothetical protein
VTPDELKQFLRDLDNQPQPAPEPPAAPKRDRLTDYERALLWRLDERVAALEQKLQDRAQLPLTTDTV